LSAARAWLAAWALLAPVAAWACPMCMAAVEENRSAYMVGTLFLIGLPLVMILALALYLRRKLREQEQEDEAARALPEHLTRPPQGAA
jgi:hypothetical protein